MARPGTFESLNGAVRRTSERCGCPDLPPDLPFKLVK